MSRLDRLVVLLETGSTPFIRNTAADQLSDLAKGHPEETINFAWKSVPILEIDQMGDKGYSSKGFWGNC